MMKFNRMHVYGKLVDALFDISFVENVLSTISERRHSGFRISYNMTSLILDID